jgi:WD40 repeat protein
MLTMKRFLPWLIGGLLLLSLTACNLAEVTPLPTEEPTSPVLPSFTPSQAPIPTVQVTEVVTLPIRLTNTLNLQLSQRAAVSNIQNIVWSQDSSTLALITQNADADDNQVYGVSILDARDLSPRSVFTSVGNRISAVAADGHTVAVIDRNMQAFSIVDAVAGGTTLGSKVTDFLISNVTFSPDMSYIAVTKHDSWEVVLYDFNTLQEVRVLSGFETAAPVFDARFDHSPQWIAWLARGTLQLQEVETGRLSGVFSHEDFVTAYAIAPQGTILASSFGTSYGEDLVSAVRLWDMTTSTLIQTLIMNYSVNDLQFSPDEKLLAAAVGSDLQLWDPASGVLLNTLSGHSDLILQIAISPDQHTIATAGLVNQLFLWQIIE